MYNSGRRGKRASDGYGIVSQSDNFNQKEYLIPRIDTYQITDGSYNVLPDDAVDTAGGQTILLIGSGFAPGITVTVGGNTISVVTYISPNKLSFVAPALSSANYTIVASNTNGGTGILVPGLVYSGVPNWSSPAAGSYASVYETTPVTQSFVATGDGTITYSLYSGTLPAGANLASDGTLTGDAPADSGSTTYSFTIRATDAQDQHSDRSFSLTINTDVVTWSTPTNDQLYNVAGGSAMSPVTLSATSAAGYGVQYAANTLPTGVSLSGNIISGTPTTAQTIYTQLTATANTTGRSAIRTISWFVTLGDTYWKNTSLLISGDTASNTFIHDASLNNQQITINGDVRPSNFNPYSGSYYSAYFDGANYATVSVPAFGTGNWTIEGWLMLTGSLASNAGIFHLSDSNYLPSNGTGVAFATYNSLWHTYSSGTSFTQPSSPAPRMGEWTHFALVKNNSVFTLYINGVAIQTGADTTNYTATYLALGGYYSSGYLNAFHLSNFRIVSGTALYTGNFTPPTSPLTAIANTNILTCQSKSLVDNSPGNRTITKSTIVSANSANPFTAPTSASYNTQYSYYFNGSTHLTDALTSSVTIGTNDFCLEGWGYWTSFNDGTYGSPIISLYGASAGELMIRANKTSASSTTANWFSILGGSTYIPSAMYSSGVSGGTLYLNRWHHLAVSRRSGVWSFFIDGVRVSTTSSGDASLTLPFTTAYIGADGPSGGGYMTGQVSNVRLVVGDYVYDGSTYTVPTSALTAITGTKLLTCQDNSFKDNSGYTTHTFTPSGAGTYPVAVSPFTMTTANNSLTSIGSVYFDGTGDYLSIPSSPAFTFAGDFTIEAWINPTVINTNNNIISRWLSSLGFIFKIVTSGRPYFAWYIGSSGTVTGTSTAVVINQWNHVAVTRSGTTVRLFVNGVVDATTGTASGAFNSSTSAITIGALTTGADEPFTGYIGDIRVVNGTALYTANFLPPQAPLTPVANTQLLTCQTNIGGQNNSFVDQSNFNHVITRTGNVTQGTFSPYAQTGWSGQFKGASSQYVTAAHNAALNLSTGSPNFTIECWFYCSALTGGYQSILDKDGISGSSYAQYGFLISSSGVLSFYVGHGDNASTVNGTEQWFTMLNPITLNRWYHIAAVQSSSNQIKVFVDGSLISTTTRTQNMVDGGKPVYIGYQKDQGSAQFFNGYISNVRIVNGTALYSSSFTPSITPLDAVANTVLLTCQSNRFVDNGPHNITLTPYGSASIQAASPFGGVTTTIPSYSNYFNYGDGTGDYLTLPTAYSPTLGILANSLTTIEFWMFSTNISAVTAWYSGIFGNFAQAAVNGRYMVLAIGSNTSTPQNISFTYTTSTGATAACTTSTAVSQNTWNHIAITIDSTTPSSSTVKIYVNGVGQTFTGQNLSTHTTEPGTAFRIGEDGGSNYQSYTGYISNFRYTRGVLVYTGNFTVPTGPLSATQSSGTNISAITAGQTKLLLCQNNTVIENANTANTTLTVTGSVLPRKFNPFSSSSSTLVQYSPSVNGGSMYFDGGSDYLSVASSPSYGTLAASGKFTFEGWFYFDDVSISQQVIFSQRSTSGSYVPFLIWTSTTSIVLYSSSNNGSWNIINNATLATGLVAKQWYHFAFTRNGTTFKFFVNGVQTYTFETSTAYTNTQPLNVGMCPGETNTALKGYVSDYRFINGLCLYSTNFYPGSAPLSASDSVGANTMPAALLLTGTNGGIIDSHSSVNMETVGNVQLAPQDPYGGSYYSNYFDGSGDYFTLPVSANLAFDGDYTIECWVYLNTVSGLQGVYSSIDNAGDTWAGAYLGFSGTSFLATSYISGPDVITHQTAVVAGKWYHIAIVRNGSSTKSYLNGVQSTGTTSGTFSLTQSGGTIGSAYPGTSPLNGYISNLRVVKGTAVYTSGFTPPTAPLTDISGTQLLTCQSKKFVDNSSNNLTLTLVGDTKVKSMNPFQNNTGKSLYFDGTGDYLITPTDASNNFGTGDFTVEAWVYPNSLSGDWFITSATGTGGFFIGFSSTTTIGYGWGRVGTAWDYRVASNATAGVWQHVAVTRSGTSMRLFVNGVQSGTTQTLSTAYDMSLTSTTIGSQGANYYLNGYIKDLRVTKGVARYTTSFTPPISSLEKK